MMDATDPDGGVDVMPRIRVFAGLILSGLSLVACVPSDNFDPVAFVAIDHSVQIQYTSCSPIGVKRVEVFMVAKDGSFDDESPVWRLSFEPASHDTNFELGVKSNGGTQDVAWRGGMLTNQQYAAGFELSDGTHIWEDFVLKDLDKAGAKYQGKYVAPTDLKRKIACRHN